MRRVSVSRQRSRVVCGAALAPGRRRSVGPPIIRRRGARRTRSGLRRTKAPPAAASSRRDRRRRTASRAVGRGRCRPGGCECRLLAQQQRPVDLRENSPRSRGEKDGLPRVVRGHARAERAAGYGAAAGNRASAARLDFQRRDTQARAGAGGARPAARRLARRSRRGVAPRRPMGAALDASGDGWRG